MFLDELFCCAKAKVYFPYEPLYLVSDGTDPLECIFGVVRMKNKNSNMDYLMFLQCLASMIRCEEILNIKHPDWVKKTHHKDFVWITPVLEIGKKKI